VNGLNIEIEHIFPGYEVVGNDFSLTVQTLRMREAITKLPHMSSWCSD